MSFPDVVIGACAIASLAFALLSMHHQRQARQESGSAQDAAQEAKAHAARAQAVGERLQSGGSA